MRRINSVSNRAAYDQLWRVCSSMRRINSVSNRAAYDQLCIGFALLRDESTVSNRAAYEILSFVCRFACIFCLMLTLPYALEIGGPQVHNQRSGT
jgi:hypothetical protein